MQEHNHKYAHAPRSQVWLKPRKITKQSAFPPPTSFSKRKQGDSDSVSSHSSDWSVTKINRQLEESILAFEKEKKELRLQQQKEQEESNKRRRERERWNIIATMLMHPIYKSGWDLRKYLMMTPIHVPPLLSISQSQQNENQYIFQFHPRSLQCLHPTYPITNPHHKNQLTMILWHLLL